MVFFNRIGGLPTFAALCAEVGTADEENFRCGSTDDGFGSKLSKNCVRNYV
jgi:hypothetical protein